MKQEDSVAKILAQRTLFYCAKVGLQFLGAAILISLFSSFSEWSQTQQWVWNSKSFLWVVKGGIMITPFASFFMHLMNVPININGKPGYSLLYFL